MIFITVKILSAWELEQLVSESPRSLHCRPLNYVLCHRSCTCRVYFTACIASLTFQTYMYSEGISDLYSLLQGVPHWRREHCVHFLVELLRSDSKYNRFIYDNHSYSFVKYLGQKILILCILWYIFQKFTFKFYLF